ncbi:hypothetical protein SK128_020581, partial [Halocaridina rubra]
MDDGLISVIAEVRLQVSREQPGRKEAAGGREVGIAGEGGRTGIFEPGGRRLGGRRVTQDLRIGHHESDVLLGNYGILDTVAHGDTFGFLPSLWTSHPPLLQVNKTWVVRDDANVGTLVDTIQVLEVTGRNYNLTLHGTRGLLKLDPASGRVTVASSLVNQ